MQRQSLGSPASRDDIIIGAQESKKKVLLHHHESATARLIHLIPVLLLFCFLLLYLSSRIPSQSDLADFNPPPKHIGIMNEIGRLSEVHKNDVLGIRSHRNLQEIEKRSHRKMADF